MHLHVIALDVRHQLAEVVALRRGARGSRQLHLHDVVRANCSGSECDRSTLSPAFCVTALVESRILRMLRGTEEGQKRRSKKKSCARAVYATTHLGGGWWGVEDRGKGLHALNGWGKTKEDAPRT